MINKNKGIATIAILGIILGVLVVGGGVYYFGTNNKEIKESNKKDNEYKNYSYINEEFGFAINMPGLIVKESKSGETSVFTVGMGDQSNIEEEQLRIPNSMVIRVSHGGYDEDVNFLIKNFITDFDKDKYEINGYEYLHYIRGFDDLEAYEYFITKNNLFYYIRVNNELDIKNFYLIDNPKLKINTEMSNDSKSLSTWKDFSFNGNQYLPSLSFSYPSDWKIEYKDNKVLNTNYIKIKSPTGNTEINYFNTVINGKSVDCNYKTDVNGIVKCSMIKGLPLQLYYVKDENSLEIYNKVMSSFKVSEIKKENNNELMEITLYFGNEIKNPGSWDCSLVYPVKRMIPKTEAVARASLEELIKGPTNAEKSLGYYGTMPVETKINSIDIKDGILSIDFNKEIEINFTSCSGLFRLSSINKTLKQFSSVKEIKFAVDGNWNRDEILQP